MLIGIRRRTHELDLLRHDLAEVINRWLKLIAFSHKWRWIRGWSRSWSSGSLGGLGPLGLRLFRGWTATLLLLHAITNEYNEVIKSTEGGYFSNLRLQLQLKFSEFLLPSALSSIAIALETVASSE